MKNRNWTFSETGETAEELAWNHRMDISASVYVRMRELGMTKSELAKKLGVDKSQVSRLIKGKRNLTLQTIAEIESALQFRLDAGFKYYSDSMATSSITRMLFATVEPPKHTTNLQEQWEVDDGELKPARFKAITSGMEVAA